MQKNKVKKFLIGSALVSGLLFGTHLFVKNKDDRDDKKRDKIENVKFLNSRLDGTALQDNVNKWANVNAPDDLSTFLFKDLSKLLNPFLICSRTSIKK